MKTSFQSLITQPQQSTIATTSLRSALGFCRCSSYIVGSSIICHAVALQRRATVPRCSFFLCLCVSKLLRYHQIKRSHSACSSSFCGRLKFVGLRGYYILILRGIPAPPRVARRSSPFIRTMKTSNGFPLFVFLSMGRGRCAVGLRLWCVGAIKKGLSDGVGQAFYVGIVCLTKRIQWRRSDWLPQGR